MDPFLVKVTCLMIVILSFIAWYRRTRSQVKQFLSSLPGPRQFPLIGHTHIFLPTIWDQSGWMTVFDKYAHYKLFHLSITVDDFAVTGNAEMIQTILKSPLCYDKDKTIYDLFGMPDILTIANGKKWSTERKMVLPSFHSRLFPTFDPVYQNRTNQLLANLKRYAETGVTFDLGLEVALFSTDVLCDNFLGVSMDILMKRDEDFASSLLGIPNFFMERVVNPLYRHDFIYSLVGRKKKFDAAKGKIYCLSQEIIDKRKAYREELKRRGESEGPVSLKRSKIFLDIFLDKIETGEYEHPEELQYVVGEIFTAGSVTQAVTLCWVLVLSGIFPEIGSRLHAEVDAVVNSDGGVTIQNCDKLEYLDMVIKETLRHFTVPFIIRVPKKDLHVNDFKTIPAGTRIILLLASLHHGPNYWEKPYEFYPDHFSPENVAKRPKSAFMPFAIGGRDCPGARYAMQTMKVELGQILSELRFTPVGMSPWRNVYAENDLRFSFVQSSKNGFKAKVELKKKKG